MVLTNGAVAASSEEEGNDESPAGSGTHQAAEHLQEVGRSEPSYSHSDPESHCSTNGSGSYYSDEDEDDGDGDSDGDTSGAGENSVPTIYFSHTVEPKRVCILFNFTNFVCSLIIIYHLCF
jgi:unconventional prefoldin RPB5 interactor 1